MPTHLSADADAQYRLRAAFIYNFIRFIKWPEQLETNSREITLCVNADDNAYRAIKYELQGKEIKDKSMHIRRLTHIDDLPECWIAYNSPSVKLLELPVESHMSGKGLLTIGERPDSIQASDIIRFYIDDDQLRFEINPSMARKAGITISSKLLRLAKIVVTANGAVTKKGIQE